MITEDSYHSRTSQFVLEQPESTAYLIVDEAHMERPRYRSSPSSTAGETVEEMESALGIPGEPRRDAGPLQRVRHREGEDPDFHKSEGVRRPQGRSARGPHST